MRNQNDQSKPEAKIHLVLSRHYFATIIVLFLGLPNSIDVNAQSLIRQVIGVAGGTQQLDELNISYTLGEALVGTASSNNSRYWQASIGFQQPGSLVEGDERNLAAAFQVFPNPTSGLAYVQSLEGNFPTLNIRLSTLYGQVLWQQTVLDASKHQIDLSPLPAGIYLLQINYQDGRHWQSRLVKTE